MRSCTASVVSAPVFRPGAWTTANLRLAGPRDYISRGGTGSAARTGALPSGVAGLEVEFAGSEFAHAHTLARPFRLCRSTRTGVHAQANYSAAQGG